MKNSVSLFILSFILIYSCSTEQETPSPVIQTPQSEGETPSTVQYNLTVTAGEGGTVSTEGGTFDEGTQITITASANEGYIFSGWSTGESESSIQIVIGSNTTISANFTQIQFQTSYVSPMSPFLGNNYSYDYDESVLRNIQVVSPIFINDEYFYDYDQLVGSNDWIAAKQYSVNDFNNDGYNDVLFSFISTQDESVPFLLYLFNPSTFAFEDSSDLIQNNIGQEFTRNHIIGHLNDDNILDFIAVSHPESIPGKPEKDLSYFDVVLSNGNNSWSQERLSIVSRSQEEGYYHGASIGDVDNDGDNDIVLAVWHNDNGNQTYLNDGNANFTKINSVSENESDNIFLEKNAFTVELLHLNDDDCLDLIYWGNLISIIKLGNCDGTFGPDRIEIENDYAWDFITADLNSDGRKELLIHSPELSLYGNPSLAGLNVYDFNDISQGVQGLVKSIPIDVEHYFTINKIENNKYLIADSNFLSSGGLDYNYTDGNVEARYNLNKISIVDETFNVETLNFPITTPVEKIEYSNDSNKLSWKAGLLQNIDNPYYQDNPMTLDNLRGNIIEWHIYTSNNNFIDTDSANVQKTTILDSEIEKVQLENNEFVFSAPYSPNTGGDTYVRVSYKLDNGLINNLSYAVRIHQ